MDNVQNTRRAKKIAPSSYWHASRFKLPLHNYPIQEV